ncbi:MAG: NAD(P)H-dependent oxidoreductase [Stigonema ocellatum SAG 48.90 = DSM 106950]|nr:NAD(P)H-dependent oxidoreductase [Stigonema ocellatum SAG 48.90 = DSM 106950]
MKVFIVHSHPEPESFNGALTRYAKEVLEAAGHEVKISDLYQMNFNPVTGWHNFTKPKNPNYFKQLLEEIHASEVNGFAPDILTEIEKLEWCDVLIFQFPISWFSLPAILKGWVERVFVHGRIYGNGKFYDQGLFQGKKAMLSLTTGSPENAYTENGVGGNIHTILFPIHHGILYLVGFDVLPPFVAYSAAHIRDDGRKAYLEAYKQRLLSINETPSIAYPPLAAYDENLQLKQ